MQILPFRSRGVRSLVMVCDVDLAQPDATRTHTVEVARGFAAEGYEVHLVTRGSDPCLAGVRHHAPAARPGSRLRRLAAVNGLAVRVLLRQRGRADALYLRADWGSTPTLLAARALGMRVVVQVDDVPYGNGYRTASRGLRHLVADRVKCLAARVTGRAAANVVAVTDNIKQLLVGEFGVPAHKVHVLPNGVNLELFRPTTQEEARARLALDPSRPYAVFAGLFASWVDFEVMLDAWAVVARARPEARFLLVGDGPMAGEVDERIRRLGIEEHVVRLGFVSDRARVSDLMAAADVCLVAYHWGDRGRIGASPVKLSEYFAAGRPVVGVHLPGMREMIEESGAGISVPRDAAAMAEAIGALLDDPSRARELGERGRQAARDVYSWSSVVRRTVPLLEAA
jgi:glycosyltransferase involved in cell wall biosynthesis